MSSERPLRRQPRDIAAKARKQIARIRAWTADLDAEAYEADERTQFACERAFIALGEALKDLMATIDVHAIAPDGPWIDPVRFRNFLAHEYDDRVLPPLVWRTITQDLPPLDDSLRRVEAALNQA
ncbi:MAG: HepT-like ribonuclease domain-containing protein [Hyphomonadaceae bacterium]|nr:HepT-like ribonuclease domain-containing protein [Hyphomonadaceae bacterium]